VEFKIIVDADIVCFGESGGLPVGAFAAREMEIMD
jgi:glutamate-1-semialdehyde aminotransferase